jgi:hypothetical protein
MDLFYSILLKLNDFSKSKEYKIDDILNESNKNLKTLNLGRDEYNLIKNELYHMMLPNNTIINKLLGLISKLKVTDIPTFWESNEECYREIETIFKIKLNSSQFDTIYKKSMKLNELSSTNFLTYLALNGLGAHLVKPINNINDLTDSFYTIDETMSSSSEDLSTIHDSDVLVGYEIDLLYMQNFQVRSDFFNYGAKIVFDKNFNVLYIETPTSFFNQRYKKNTITRPNSKYWNFASNIFISSLIAHVTIVNHAVYCHFMNSGNMLYINESSKQVMNPHLYLFLKLFLFKTSVINTNALNLLINKGGVVNRLFAFTPESCLKFMKYHIERFDNHFIIDLILQKQPDYFKKIPLLQDANDFISCLRKFVVKFINIVYPEKVYEDYFLQTFKFCIPNIIQDTFTNKENLINSLIYHIFNVTFWHEHVGNMGRYVLSPQLIKSKVYLNNPLTALDSKQNSIQNIHLALFTSSV